MPLFPVLVSLLSLRISVLAFQGGGEARANESKCPFGVFEINAPRVSVKSLIMLKLCQCVQDALSMLRNPRPAVQSSGSLVTFYVV